MAEKDKASPGARMNMEERWRKAREACEQEICDPGDLRFHKAGCSRRVTVRKTGGDAVEFGSEKAEPDSPLEPNPAVLVSPVDPFHYSPHGLPDMTRHENWGETPVMTEVMTEPSGIKYGGWIAPSRCAAGVCLPHDEHDADCAGPGAAYNPPGWSNELLEIPAMTASRGGLRFLPVTLAHEIRPVRTHWWSREWFEVWTHVNGSASPAIFMGLFRTRQEANESAGDLNKLNLEINRRRDQIDDSAAR